MRYENDNWTTLSDYDILINSFYKIDSYQGVPYILYNKGYNWDEALSVQKYESSTWPQVRSSDFSTGAAVEIDLVVDSNGPWVRYLDGSNAYWETIINYTGGSWQLAGAVLESKDAVISSYNNVLYTTYNYGDYGAGYLAKVKYLSSNQWQALGSIGITDSDGS